MNHHNGECGDNWDIDEEHECPYMPLDKGEPKISFTPNEMAKIISTLSNAAASMESYNGKKRTIALAKNLYKRCLSDGIVLSPYDKLSYGGKTYKTKPNIDDAWGSFHDGWEVVKDDKNS